jgi:hypothetical protein
MTLKNVAYAAIVGAAAAAFVLGSAATGEAKAKKMMAETPKPPLCLYWHKTVCGSKSGHLFTYANPCFAEKDGAKVVAQHACKKH